MLRFLYIFSSKKKQWDKIIWKLDLLDSIVFQLQLRVQIEASRVWKERKRDVFFLSVFMKLRRIHAELGHFLWEDVLIKQFLATGFQGPTLVN